jgi:hypothetical protein
MRPTPDGLQVRCEILEFLSGGNHGLLLALHGLIDAFLDLADTLSRLIPASFQLVGDQAIFRIGRVVLFLRSASRVPRRFQLAGPRVQDLILLMGRGFTRDDGGLDRGGLHDAQDFLGHRVVDHYSSKGDAARFTVVARASDADVAKDIVRVASVTDDQFPPTASTAEQTG